MYEKKKASHVPRPAGARWAALVAEGEVGRASQLPLVTDTHQQQRLLHTLSCRRGDKRKSEKKEEKKNAVDQGGDQRRQAEHWTEIGRRSLVDGTASTAVALVVRTHSKASYGQPPEKKSRVRTYRDHTSHRTWGVR